MQEKRYNSKGEELFFQDGIWVPKECILTEMQKDEYYSRFTHPHINWIKTAIVAVLSVALIAISAFAAIALSLPLGWKIAVPVCFAVLLFAVHLKRIAIFMIRLYQYFAPMRIRERCVFTPTCSDYMIAAIEKYGFFKGVKKGIGRLKRCGGEFREDPLE